MREFIKNMDLTLPPSALPMTQMHGQRGDTSRPGQCSDVREVTGSEAGKVLVKGPEKPRGSGCYPGNQETIPQVLMSRSEVVEQCSSVLF